MKFGLLSKRFINGATNRNLAVMIGCMKQYAGQRIDLLCFGETFLQGFDALTWEYEADRRVALAKDSPPLQALAEAARTHRTGVTFGYIEREGGLLYSSQAVLSSQGEWLAHFRRVSPGWKVPSADPRFYREGDGFRRFRWKGRWITMGLCGDLWEDESITAIRSLRVDVVLWPVYVDYSVERWNRVERAAYAERAGMLGEHVLLFNSICDGDGRAKGGAAYFRRGQVEAELPCGRDGILTITI